MAEKAYCTICDRNFKDEAGLMQHNSSIHKNSNNQCKTESRKINKLFIGFIIAFILLAGLIYLEFGRAGTTGNAVNNADDVQKINIGFKDYNYYPRTIKVKSGIPVEITLDNSVGGCFRNFVIRDLGVSQYSSNPSIKIKFTPNEKGSFRFSCSMGMASGIIVVE